MLLLQPYLLSIRNRFFLKPGNTLRTGLIFCLGLALFIGLYLVSLRVIGYFHGQNELGIILSMKIFQMAWMIFFTMLIFSSMVSAVSSIYLSSDNEILYTAPVTDASMFQMRCITSFIYTSWMMVIFSLPVFWAYGKVFQAGFFYFPIMALAVVSIAVTASGIGLAATILLVNLFPARRTKDIVVYLSLLFGILLYLVIRLMRPEDLADPDKFPDFIAYLSNMQTPAFSFLPPAWANQLLNGYLQERIIDWLALGLLLLTPLVIYFLGEWLMSRYFFSGFSKAQESFGGTRSFKDKPYQPAPMFRIFHKEGKMFIRDSSEWSQLFLIGALIIVYLYNFKALPLDRTPMPTEYLTNMIAYANIALSGFLAASLATRFVYPSIGAEGMAFDIIRSSPLSMQRYLWCKYLFYWIPFTIISLILIIASNSLLQIEGPMWWISIILSLIITWTVLAMSLGFGAMNADFKAESRAAVQGSLGAIMFLFTSLAVELLLIAFGFFGNYRLVKRWLQDRPIDGLSLLQSSGTIFMIGFCGVLISIWCVRKGVRSLNS